ncbi:TRAP transporter substrate-binding protein DctP [Noviherbaspirillum sp.]|uniref:TRAP transporter substrate-binding protein n=1 Tax=Noviherbaspirillum sp. TaxID=1926288 RepID=UPI002B47DDE8|nr:TRAP transporter substrate-binding protein DctP [Noviherbaspirillum sp.]HJV79691.1 TRAP transporter substrate-binding protein DctP [Noviherbaspirillum sp.]
MKTNTHVRLTLKGLVAAVGLCLALPSMSAYAADKKIMIRFAGTLPVAHHITKTQEYFKKLVEERSNGRITVQVYPAGQLYKDVDLVDVIPKGSVEMAIANLGQWSGLVPQLAIFDLTGNWSGREHFYRSQDDSKVREVIARAMEKRDTHLLNTIDYGEGTYITNKPLKTLEDFKGMRIRASTEYNTIQVQTLGGASSLISSAEIYQGLSLGTIDGAITGPSSFISRKLYEVAKYDMNSSQGYGNFGTVVSLKWWNSLPPDVKDLLTKAGKEAEAWCRKSAQAADAAAWEKLSSIPGNVVYKVEPAELARWAKIMLPPQMKLYRERAGKDADILLERIEALRNQ